ncbi:hypothetical protein RHGRI_004318 [Rhododendron griersonianum]|uniref:Uncharacterized protein n=1 Tax=Rhododendron griersonianum TaxID=479676 RepID=A0AAV6L8G4_9ERIC|nr:hypothetical protein RHGRI_004318 [Rhododendron griersonianum]
MGLRTEPPSHIFEGTRGLRTGPDKWGSVPNPRAIFPRAPEGSVPTPETYYQGLRTDPPSHITEGIRELRTDPRSAAPRAPCKPPTLDETQHREESSRRADLAMCSVTTLSLSSYMTSPEAVTRAYSPRASLEATQT